MTQPSVRVQPAQYACPNLGGLSQENEISLCHPPFSILLLGLANLESSYLAVTAQYVDPMLTCRVRL